MTKIKICGLRSEEDISRVNELKPDYIGFVFVKGRRRYISPRDADLLRTKLDEKIQSVGVFVDAPIKEVAGLLEKGTVQMIQLHGCEDEDYVKRLKQLCDRPVIKAFVIRTSADVEKARTFPADYLLLDSGQGTGETFDWSLLKGMNRPFFLAGGLNPDNVIRAISDVHPYGVDVSSGVETDGRKDYDKMKAFIEMVRSKS